MEEIFFVFVFVFVSNCSINLKLLSSISSSAASKLTSYTLQAVYGIICASLKEIRNDENGLDDCDSVNIFFVQFLPLRPICFHSEISSEWHYHHCRITRIFDPWYWRPYFGSISKSWHKGECILENLSIQWRFVVSWRKDF